MKPLRFVVALRACSGATQRTAIGRGCNFRQRPNTAMHLRDAKIHIRLLPCAGGSSGIPAHGWGRWLWQTSTQAAVLLEAMPCMARVVAMDNLCFVSGGSESSIVGDCGLWHSLRLHSLEASLLFFFQLFFVNLPAELKNQFEMRRRLWGSVLTSLSGLCQPTASKSCRI